MAGQTGFTVLVAQAETGATAPAATEDTATHTTTTEVAGDAAHASAGFPPFDTSTFAAQLFWLAICFGALYIIVARVVQPRLTAILEARRDKIEGDLAEADRLRTATDKAIADYEAALAAARAKANGIAQQTRDANKAELDGKRVAVETELAKKMTTAEASIQRAKTEALGNVDEIAAETAAALVGQLAGTVTADEARAAVASVVKG